MEKKIKKTSFWDWKQKFGLFLLIVSITLVLISLILFASASFIDQYNHFLGDGFWSLKYYGVINIFNNWDQLDNIDAINAYVSHPFTQIYIGIIFIIIICPICFGLGIILFIRGWLKSRI